MKYRFIAIEGNIGAGKTTLARQLAAHYNAALLLEQFAENPFLPLFYKEKEKYALPLELCFLKDRYKQLKAFLKEHQNVPLIVADYAILKSPLFAKNNLDEKQFELFCNIHDMMKVTVSKPDLFIYLHTPIDRLQRHIKQRGRPYEQNISDNYLIEIENAYLQYFRREAGNILWLDNTTADFNKPEYFNRLIEYIESGKSFPERFAGI